MPNSSHWRLLIFTGVALSIGWGIRGNFGHEFGAMIPGALAVLTAILFAGRTDWLQRAPHFAFLGALGWSLGGSISYMQVIGYTHSGHSSSVLYGFACLFAIGFVWAAPGGAGLALPAILPEEKLHELYCPLLVLFGAWALQDFAIFLLGAVDPQFRHQDPLYWYDTDWLAALVALGAMLLVVLAQRRFSFGVSLILHMAIGWWLGFLILVIGLGWRMTPPRGDNWAGCVGMTLGLWVFLARHGCRPALKASVLSGAIGGCGFALAACLKLLEVKSGWQTNYHSILEQTYGFINGLGLGAAALCLLSESPPESPNPSRPAWQKTFAILFVLVGITWLNLSKNPPLWVKVKAVPPEMYGLSANAWFNLAYAGILAALWILIRRARQGRVAMLPNCSAGKTQLLLLVFLWWMIIGNFERALVSFQAQRLVTEGVLLLNALLLTVAVLAFAPELQPSLRPKPAPWPLFSRLQNIAVLATVLAVAAPLLCWGIVRAVYGDQFAGHAGLHIRFGPKATAVKEPPKFGQPHP